MTEWTIYLNGPDALKAEALRNIAQIFELKDNVLRLNREIASRDHEIQKLNQRIKDLKEAGSWTRDDREEFLLELLEDKYPGHRTARQRREIAILHRIIKELKEQINA